MAGTGPDPSRSSLGEGDVLVGRGETGDPAVDEIEVGVHPRRALGVLRRR